MKPAAPTISVIIPARNEAALIGSTVDSALRARDHYQRHGRDVGGVEILVVDNASDDGTPQALSRHVAEGVRVLACPSLGAARARNYGVRLSKGRVLVFLDADTQLPVEALTRMMELVDDRGHEAGITKLGALDGGFRARCWWTFWNTIRLLPVPKAKAFPACMFCTRSAFDEFGPFNEEVAIGEEWPILAGLYRTRRRGFVYDRTLTALSSGRRMELQPFGYTRTLVRYFGAVVSHRARVGYPDTIRHAVDTSSRAA